MAGATGTKVATPAPPVPKSGDVSKPGRALVAKGPAAKDPRFAALLAQVQRNAKKQKTHPSAAQKSAEAQAAAKPPANEKTAGAKANSVDTMQEAKAEKPKTDGFLEMLRAEIEKVMPKTLDDTQNFMEGGEKDGVKNAVSGGVSESKQAATGPTEEAAAAPPDTGAVPTRTPTDAPADPPQAAEALNTQNAVPVPKTDKTISQDQKPKDAEAQMKQAEVTDTQLKKANDPRFSAVAGAKGEVQATAKAAPGIYRKGEKAALTAGVAGATANARGGLASMVGLRGRGGSQVKSRQQQAKERDEQRRKTVTDKIEAIFTKTKAKVDEKLATLETDVMAIFDAGMNLALAEMKSWSDVEIGKYKDERYSGLRGKARWVADLFRDCPPGIKAILKQAKTRFSANMDLLAVKISSLVDARLAAAKAEITKGQQEVASYVATLPSDLKGVGKAAQTDLDERFKGLEEGIDAKKAELASSLAQKFKEANDKADEELKKIEAANAGALKKFADKLGEIIKIIAEFKGKLMAALRKGWETIKLILADPIGFLGNLIAAVKGGISAFVANFSKHLLNGLAKWLFGNLASNGITMPADLSLPSIFKLVMELLGLTYANIRARAVKLVGEPVVKAVETMAEFIQVFIRGGPAALWAHIKEQLSDLKSMVIDAIISWVTTTIITQATTKIISMFNPAGAFVQACIAIYNIVMFIIERAQQILAFIEAVINSVHAIATGSIGGAIAWIEKSLAATIPLVISFFARLIGLGGITAKIVSIVKAVQTKINKGIDWVLNKIIGGLKELIAKAGAAFKGKPDSPENTAANVERAKRELPPKIKAFLAKKPGRIRMKAQLAVWRLTYHMKSLELSGDGQGAFKGTINPVVDLGNGWTFPTNEIIKIVDEIAADLKREGQLALQRENVTVAEGATTDISRIQGGGVAAAGLPTRGTVQVGVDATGKPVAFVHQDSPINPKWGEIASPGGRGRMYPQFERELAGKPVGTWLAAMVKGQPLPAEAGPYSRQLGELYGLMYAKEPSHGSKISHQRDLTYSLMLNQVAAATEASGASGMLQNHPATYGGAQAGARSVSNVALAGGKEPAEINRKGEKSKTRAKYDQRRGREKGTVAIWFAQHAEEFKASVLAAAAKDSPVSEAKPTREQIKAFIRKKLDEFTARAK